MIIHQILMLLFTLPITYLCLFCEPGDGCVRIFLFCDPGVGWTLMFWAPGVGCTLMFCEPGVGCTFAANLSLNAGISSQAQSAPSAFKQTEHGPEHVLVHHDWQSWVMPMYRHEKPTLALMFCEPGVGWTLMAVVSWLLEMAGTSSHAHSAPSPAKHTEHGPEHVLVHQVAQSWVAPSKRHE